MSALRDAIVQALQADAPVMALATAVYPDTPPKESPEFPYIAVRTHKPARPERVFRGGGSVTSTIAYEEASFQVKAIDQSTSSATVSDIAAAVRTALDGATLTISGMTALNCEWMGDLGPYDEIAEGRQYQHQGGIYRVWAV